ncbi:prepilin peptidase [Metabacillus sediminilitoris]|uniref:Prepilin peptidase n=2 Tax=Metabacillus sediminilitoris TaxID=2567941 RepID=A0A4S4C370_9BACI|nr:A24 family peptidase [Metabacillus sediminilitoris]QGQ48835.1 prepilin peptidase [Metabacillus sediminilitoris]THF82088.1 prepilin peptidase [Metabacillus sediminilitoris]
MMLIILLCFYGLLLGSFYNVVGLRIPKNKSIVTPWSACLSCNHTLTAVELIPVVSFLLLRGKCRHCGAKISPLYPFVELMTAILFMISPILVGWNVELLISLTLVSLFMIIFVSDITYMLIPDRILLFFFGLFLIERIIYPLDPWYDSIIGGLVVFILLLLIAYVSKGGMGGGDIKLFGVLGFALGLKIVLLAFFLSTLIGTLFGMISILLGKHKKREPIPFGPSIMFGTLLAYYFGDQLILLYLSFIGFTAGG